MRLPLLSQGLRQARQRIRDCAEAREQVRPRCRGTLIKQLYRQLQIARRSIDGVEHRLNESRLERLNFAIEMIAKHLRRHPFTPGRWLDTDDGPASTAVEVISRGEAIGAVIGEPSFSPRQP